MAAGGVRFGLGSALAKLFPFARAPCRGRALVFSDFKPSDAAPLLRARWFRLLWVHYDPRARTVARPIGGDGKENVGPVGVAPDVFDKPHGCAKPHGTRERALCCG